VLGANQLVRAGRLKLVYGCSRGLLGRVSFEELFKSASSSRKNYR
jgi:hypothetical protein